jgi:hypothetical protein
MLARSFEGVAPTRLHLKSFTHDTVIAGAKNENCDVAHGQASATQPAIHTGFNTTTGMCRSVMV